ncbi:MAG TPA: glycosyltransferase family A protein [Solirubrobacteraceae bacterium]|nr:glycosyltransferase family A protein [Solirubrobacteraceae bacterium]
MPAEPTVSVVVLAYNSARWIEQALVGVVAQPYRPLDVVVVDDGSTDETAALARQFRDAHPELPVRVVSQPNSGVGAARNRGVALVRGEFVAFLDADDVWAGVSLTARVPLLKADTSIDIVLGSEQRFATEPRGGRRQLGPARRSWAMGALLLRRESLERNGPFDERVGLAEGLDWLLRARELGLREASVADVVLWRRVHDANISRGYRDASAELAGVLKASLDRRRASPR